MSDCTFDPGTPEQESCLLREAVEQVGAAVEALQAKDPRLEQWSGFLEALGGLLLPAAAVLFIVVMIAPLREVLRTRKFTIKIAGFELSAQELTDQLRREVADLQKQVAALQAPPAPETAGEREGVTATGTEAGTAVRRPGPPRVLWVDDNPANNALLIANLENSGVDVVTAVSTDEAIGRITRDPGRFGAVISDLGRTEGGTYVADAGILLLRLIRKAGIDTPFAIFTSERGVRSGRHALDEGAQTITDSAIDLRRLFLDKYLEAPGAD